jgi:hypothetical protein
MGHKCGTYLGNMRELKECMWEYHGKQTMEIPDKSGDMENTSN